MPQKTFIPIMEKCQETKVVKLSFLFHQFGLYFKYLQPILLQWTSVGTSPCLPCFFSLFAAGSYLSFSPLVIILCVSGKSGKSGAEQVNCPENHGPYATVVRLECPLMFSLSVSWSSLK